MTKGQFLRLLRRDVGLSIREAAARAGVSYGHLSELENDKVCRPGFNVIARLMAFYGENIDNFAVMN